MQSASLSMKLTRTPALRPPPCAGQATGWRCSYFNRQLRRSLPEADYSCACTQSGRVYWAPADTGCEPPAGGHPAVAGPAACRVWRQGSRDPADTVMGYLMPAGPSGSSSSSSRGGTCLVHRATLGPTPWWTLGWGTPEILEAAEIGGPNRVDVLCRSSEPAAEA